MKTSIYISATLRGFVNHQNLVVIDGGDSVKEVLQLLKEEHPELEKALFERPSPFPCPQSPSSAQDMVFLAAP